MNFNSFKYLSATELSTIKLGGKVRVFYPKNTEEFVESVDFLQKNGGEFYVLGNGSKILFSDNGYSGFLIATKNLGNVTVNGDVLTADCGVKLNVLQKILTDKSLSLFEFLSGVPACVGGLVKTNAGAFNKNVSDVIDSVTVLRNGKILEVKPNGSHYRQSFLEDNDVVIKATCIVKSVPQTVIKENILGYLNKRKNQPKTFTLGSTFINPKGDYAGRLIESVGLKGFSCNGAKISENHANFIVNVGAKSQDVYGLIKLCKEKVYERYGIILKEEIRTIGEFK